MHCGFVVCEACVLVQSRDLMASSADNHQLRIMTLGTSTCAKKTLRSLPEYLIYTIGSGKKRYRHETLDNCTGFQSVQLE